MNSSVLTEKQYCQLFDLKLVSNNQMYNIRIPIFILTYFSIEDLKIRK